MILQTIDNVQFKMLKEFDFSFLQKYGEVFKVFDDQDSGNICFGMEKGDKKYFVKFAGAPTAEYTGNPTDAITRLKHTIPIYNDIRHKNLIKYLYSEEIGNGFAMVYDWVDGKCMGRMYLEEHISIMKLPICDKNCIFDAILSFLQHVVSVGYVAVDFYDGSIMYDEISQTVTMCDIDFFQKSPYINSMGKMWGSPRFISPEECKLGATIDEITNVFTIGQMAFSLYTDSNRSREVWPLSEEKFNVLQKAISESRDERFSSIIDFCKAWYSSI